MLCTPGNVVGKGLIKEGQRNPYKGNGNEESKSFKHCSYTVEPPIRDPLR